jgi:hypothetical protein
MNVDVMELQKCVSPMKSGSRLASYLECLKGDRVKVAVMVEDLVITLLCTRAFKGKGAIVH